MLLLAPVAILVLTVLALAASNLQRDFRSSWIVALIGASLAWLSLLFLRLQLPLVLNIPAWRIGVNLEFAAIFALDEVSWPLAFMVASLCMAALLGHARQAVGAVWHSWAPNLIATAASLLAVVAADPLTLFFSWILLDILVLIFLIVYVEQAGLRKDLLRGFILLLISAFMILAAWSLSFYGDQLISIMIIAAVAVRLGLVAPPLRLVKLEPLRSDLATTLILAPIAAGFPVLARSTGLPEPARAVVLLFVLVIGLYLSISYFLEPAGRRGLLWELGMATLAIAAAVGGQTLAAVAFSLLALVGSYTKMLVQSLPKLRYPASILGAALFVGLPFTASQQTGVMYANWSSPLIFVFFIIQGVLIAGWLRAAMQARTTDLPPEPWMRSVEWVSLAVLPIVFVVFGLGLLPIFESPQQPPLWPVAVLAMIAAAAFFFGTRLASALPSRFHVSLELIFSMQWLVIATRLVSQGIAHILDFANLLLEGQAGVLWAMLLMTLLISLAAQFGLGG